MAEEALVDLNRPFYEAARNVLLDLHQDARWGRFYLGALIQFEGRAEDEWTLLLGSKGLVADRTAGMHAVAEHLGAKLAHEHSRQIVRLGIVAEDDPFFVALSNAVGVGPMEQRFGVCLIGYVIVPERVHVIVYPHARGNDDPPTIITSPTSKRRWATGRSPPGALG